MALRIIHAEMMQKIEVVFMVSGHSYLSCDRAFGQIEMKIRKLRSIFCPEDYEAIIRSAVGKENNVFHMTQEDFFSFRSLKPAVTDRPAPGFSQARQLVVDAQYPEGYIIKKNTYLFDMEIPDGVDRRVRLMPGRNKYDCRFFNLSQVDLPQKYPGPVKLTPEKLKDIKALWGFLDTKGRTWLDQLLTFQGADVSHVEEDTEDEHRRPIP